jgi:hypothetical protein
MLSIFSLLAVAATAHAQVNNADLVAKLLTANTQATRIQDIVVLALPDISSDQHLSLVR